MLRAVAARHGFCHGVALNVRAVTGALSIHRCSFTTGSKREKAPDGDEFDIDYVEEAPSDQELGFAGKDFEKVVVENDDWGQKALDCALSILQKREDLELYAFRAMSANKRVDIRIDKLTDTYGSPSLDEIGEFSRDFNESLESVIGEEAAGQIEIEVSSPGADRAVKVPDELTRFQSLPMVVRSLDNPDSRIFNFVEMKAEDMTVWKYADVKANRSLGKGRGLSKKQKEALIEILVQDLDSVTLHIDL